MKFLNSLFVIIFYVILSLVAKNKISAIIVSPRYKINRCLNAEIITETWEIPQILANNGDSIRLPLVPSDPSCPLELRKSGILSTSSKISDADFLWNGYFRFGVEFYHPSEYCLQRISSDEVRINVCEKSCSEVKPCISSCCPLGQGLNGNSCQPLPKKNATINPFPYSIAVVKEDDTLLTEEDKIVQKFHFTQAKGLGKNCRASDGTFPPPEIFIPTGSNQLMNGVKFHLDGGLSFQDVVYSKGEWIRLNPGNYCLDNWSDETIFGRTTVFVCLHNTSTVSPEYKPSINEGLFRQRQLALGITLVVASIFPLMTFIVYVFILRQKNIHGLTVTSLALTMFFMYIFLCISNFINAFEDRNSLKTFRCKAVGFLGNYFFLALFCWLTVTCFDLWWTFRRMKPSGSTRRTKFGGYVVFGWGLPIVFVFTGAMFDTYYTCPENPNLSCFFTPPRYGHQNCYLSMQALGIYLYYPAAVLLLLNMIFFVLTVVKLKEYNESTKFATEQVAKKRRTLLLSIKLFLVMGIFWIFEVISWKFDDFGWGWFVVDVVKNLQAVGLFVIFVCKKQTWAEMRKWVKVFEKPRAVSTDVTLQSK